MTILHVFVIIGLAENRQKYSDGANRLGPLILPGSVSGSLLNQPPGPFTDSYKLSQPYAMMVVPCYTSHNSQLFSLLEVLRVLSLFDDLSLLKQKPRQP